jgi:short-subunit dehydrogenase
MSSFFRPSTFVGLAAAFFYMLATSDCDLCLRYSSFKPEFVKGKVVWITGASSGIGQAIAMEVAQHGGKLILSSRNKDKLEAVKSQLPAGAQAVVIPLDLYDLDSLPAKVALAVQAFGTVDVLVNNGGISTRALATEAAFEVIEKVNRVDYLGQIRLTTSLLPTFIAQKSGHIINISSIAGKFGVPLRSAYSAAKSALLLWMDSLRAEASAQEHGIHITNVRLSSPYHDVWIVQACVFVRLLTASCEWQVCPGSVQTKVSENALTAGKMRSVLSVIAVLKHSTLLDSAVHADILISMLTS